VFALVGLRMPEDARPHFLAFQGQRQIEHMIAKEPKRVATAWIGTAVMLGGEDSGGSHRVNDQFHPATIHWLIEGGQVGWIRLRHAVPIDARAERNQLAIVCSAPIDGDQEFIFQIAAPQIDLAALQPGRWELPGLIVRLETNADVPIVARAGELVEVRYRVGDDEARGAIHFTLYTEQG